MHIEFQYLVFQTQSNGEWTLPGVSRSTALETLRLALNRAEFFQPPSYIEAKFATNLAFVWSSLMERQAGHNVLPRNLSERIIEGLEIEQGSRWFAVEGSSDGFINVTPTQGFVDAYCEKLAELVSAKGRTRVADPGDAQAGNSASISSFDRFVSQPLVVASSQGFGVGDLDISAERIDWRKVVASCKWGEEIKKYIIAHNQELDPESKLCLLAWTVDREFDIEAHERQLCTRDNITYYIKGFGKDLDGFIRTLKKESGSDLHAMVSCREDTEEPWAVLAEITEHIASFRYLYQNSRRTARYAEILAFCLESTRKFYKFYNRPDVRNRNFRAANRGGFKLALVLFCAYKTVVFPCLNEIEQLLKGDMDISL